MQDSQTNAAAESTSASTPAASIHTLIKNTKNQISYYSCLAKYKSDQGNIYTKVIKGEKTYEFLSDIGEETILSFLHTPRKPLQVATVSKDAPSDKEIHMKNFNFNLQYKPVEDLTRRSNLLTIFAKWSASQFATVSKKNTSNSTSKNSKRKTRNEKTQEKLDAMQSDSENLVDDEDEPISTKKTKITSKGAKNEEEKQIEPTATFAATALEQKFDAKLQMLETKIDSKFNELVSLIRSQSQMQTATYVPPNILSQYSPFAAQNNQGNVNPNNSIYFYHTFRLEKQ